MEIIKNIMRKCTIKKIVKNKILIFVIESQDFIFCCIINEKVNLNFKNKIYTEKDFYYGII